MIKILISYNDYINQLQTDLTTNVSKLSTIFNDHIQSNHQLSIVNINNLNIFVFYFDLYYEIFLFMK